MEQAMLIVTGEGLQNLDILKNSFSIARGINVDAKTAQRKVTGWAVSEVSNMLIAGEPHLLIGHMPVWHVPVMLCSTYEGVLGEVASIDVNALTGELLLSKSLPETILNNAKALTSSSSSPAS
jgi:hypothetical protein